MKTVKRWLKRLGWFVLILLISLNLFILLSGRFYLYRGVYMTYLRGENSPTIYDFDYFSEAKVAKKTGRPWKFNLLKDEKALESYLAYAEKWQSTSLLVLHGDTVKFEKYWGDHHPSTVSNSFSSAKTVVSLLIGCAIDEGKIKSLDEPVCHYLKGFSGKGKEKITIRHLLMMSSGLDWQESGKNPLSENAESYYGTELWKLVNRQQVERKPGEIFLYQSGNSQLLGFIVEKATGKRLWTYASEKLWQPMEAESDAFWSLDKENGDPKAFCCLYSTTRDFARIGKLIANNGVWNGKRLLSEQFMKEFVKNGQMTTEEGIPNTRYALHVWTYNYGKKHVVYCRGIKGQYIIAVPEDQLVIVRTGHKRAPDIEIPVGKKLSAKTKSWLYPMVGHPSDLFEYLAFGEKVLKESK